MSTREALQLGESDAALAGDAVPEVAAVHVYHMPGDDRALNGVTFVIRTTAGAFTVSVREDVVGDGSSESEAIPYPTGGDEYLRFFRDRHASVDIVQREILSAASEVIVLLRDLKGA